MRLVEAKIAVRDDEGTSDLVLVMLLRATVVP